jgi:predicted RNase H-like nuclease (RuvC/YqgF family)
VPAVSYDQVRSDDVYTQQMREEQVVRHRFLTMRDHVIGLESRIAAADQRLAEAHVIINRLQARVNRMAKELRELRRLRQSMTWRAGRVVTSPGRLGRKTRDGGK